MSLPSQAPLRVAVIGGGPAGLATLKYLVTAHNFFPSLAPIDARLFEASSVLGGVFSSKIYEDSEMVSSKYLTAFSDARLPASEPDFLPAERYAAYLLEYAERFGLLGKVHLRTRVMSVRKMEEKIGAGFVLQVQQELKGGNFGRWAWVCDAVAVCSGLNETPCMPEIKGAELVKNQLHSQDLKLRAQFPEGGTVVVLGAGETGLDMAWLAATSKTARVILCHRDGFFCGPKIVPAPRVLGLPLSAPKRPNKPVDCSVAALFDTAYVPPVLQRGPLLWWYYNSWIKAMHTLISGTHEGPDQWVGHMPKGRKHVKSLFFVKSTNAIPYLSTNHRSDSLLNRIRSWLINVPTTDTRGRRIDTGPWPHSVSEEGILEFSPKELKHDEHASVIREPVRPDMIVWATGFQPSFATKLGLDEASVRGVYAPGDGVRLGFIGFVRPSIGAIPPLAELQAQFWILHLLQHLRPLVVPPRDREAIPPYELDYALHPRAFQTTHPSDESDACRRTIDMAITKHGIDHESYAYQLAVDMGAAPTITHVVRRHGWRTWWVWAMGPSFNAKFRMLGPWRMDKEELRDVMEGELWGVTARTGGWVFFSTYTLIPMVVVGMLSMLIWMGAAIASIPRKLRRLVSVFAQGQRPADGEGPSTEDVLTLTARVSGRYQVQTPCE